MRGLAMDNEIEKEYKEGQNFYEEELLYSIAISLKRIADIMDGKQQPVIMSAEEYSKYKGK
jgi:hypothetical protein